MKSIEDLTIAEAQARQPWTVPYSRGVMRAEEVPHILASHAVMHAAKSVGKLAAVFEALDHRDTPITDQEISTIEAMAADLFTIALRFANLYKFSLVRALRRRVFEKNGVSL